MSGTQGRFPPPVPPQAQRRPLPDFDAPATTPSQAQQPQPGWPPAVPQATAQPPQFGQRQLVPGHQAAPAYYDPASDRQAPAEGFGAPAQTWSPAPPAPFPPLPGQAQQRRAPPPQFQQPSYGYPGQPQSDPVRTEPSRRPPESRLPDPASYDLGSYGLPPQHQQQQPQQVPPSARDPRMVAPPVHAQPPSTHPGFGAPSLGQPAPAWPPQHQGDAFARTGPGTPLPPPQQFGYPQQPAAPAQSATPAAVEEEEYEVEEPPRRSRKWLVLTALVGSIAIGSGLAYAYKTFMGPKVAADSKNQVVRASREPVKVPPADRGGKQFSNTDSRVLNNRVPSEGTSAASGGDVTSTGTTDSNGVRRVATVPVGPSVGPAAGGVPGMMVVGPNTGPALPPSMMEPPRTAAQPTAPAAQPTRVAAAPPAPSAAAVPQPPPAPPRQPVVRSAPVEAEPPQRTAAVAPKAPAPDRPKVVSGYVAVLGFQKSQVDAMRMMADLQQKYDVLRDKRLEIVQSDQSSRGLGTIYRVVVGPRGGITPVRDLCNNLFQAGMPKQGCYPLGE